MGLSRLQASHGLGPQSGCQDWVLPGGRRWPGRIRSLSRGDGSVMLSSHFKEGKAKAHRLEIVRPKSDS